MHGRHLQWRWGAIALVGGLLWAAASHAEAPGRIGFFSADRVDSQTGIQEQSQKEFKAKLEERKKALEAIQGELDQLSERFKLESGSLAEEQRKAREAEIDQKFADLKRDKDRYQQELMSLDRGGRVMANRIIAQAVKEIGQEQGYAAILDGRRAGVYYVQPELDVTQAIVRRIKEKLAAGQAPEMSHSEAPASPAKPLPQ
jgi:Skp family chaperone for outer membrane proteins